MIKILYKLHLLNYDINASISVFFFSEYRKTYSGPKKEKKDNKDTANEKAAKKWKKLIVLKKNNIVL